MRNEFLIFSALTLIGVGLLSYFISPKFSWILLFAAPLILLGVYDMFQKKHALIRNFPILGRGRYIMEDLRPKLYQYFIESDTNGTPIPRNHRSIVYQRAKNVLDTKPFGTQENLYSNGYEFVNHSIVAGSKPLEGALSIRLGGKITKQPYDLSILNISAMSYGSLSNRAVQALNGGAKIGNFAHNTGEGGISPYHLAEGGDLIFQIGTGYFGARDEQGRFSPEKFQENALRKEVKVIELKLSQGAKPGHGGILPAKKNTLEISKIRGVVPHVAVHSPPGHTAFSTPRELILFLDNLRLLSDGKPVGFKLCLGKKSEFIGICKAMVELDIFPDYIAVDGGEGGTGAAPLEFLDTVGSPLVEGLVFVEDALIGFGIRDKIKIMAAGKVISGFHILRMLALGADACYSARAMLMALGCIQALECNKNTCPTGIATQDKELIAGLDVQDKRVRVANYHHKTLEAFEELISATSIDDLAKIDRSLISRRTANGQVKTLEEIFPYPAEGCLLSPDQVPMDWELHYAQASADHF